MGKPWRMVVSEGRTELKEAWDDLFGLKEQTPGECAERLLTHLHRAQCHG